MKDQKVISKKNLPTRLPIGMTALGYILMDKFNSPGYAWGIWGTLMVIIWAASIAVINKQEEVDILNK